MIQHLSLTLDQLSRTLEELKRRLRATLIAELAHAVAEAARQTVTNALAASGSVKPIPDDPPHHYDGEYDPWGDDNPWHHSLDREHVEPVVADRHVPAPAEPPPQSTRPAITLGLLASQWWFSRRGAPLQAVAVGTLIGLATWLGGPLLATCSTVISTAVSLAAACSSG